MGHERIGFLPKRKQWQAIVLGLSEYEIGSSTTAKIANDTLSCIQKSYAQMPYNESISKAIKFLALIAVSAKQPDQLSFLRSNGCDIDDTISLYTLVDNAKGLITTDKGSLEVHKLAIDAVLQAMTIYQRDHTSNQLSFLSPQSEQVWQNVGSGAAFCELARSFFASFTDRQIKYYVERSAASAINDYAAMQSFTLGITHMTDAISHHAFETSKIMQSFAAGWFNKHANTSIPSDKEVTDFLRISFGKMREEFRREAEKE